MKPGEVFTGYCVKYALTSGIFEAEFRTSSSGAPYAYRVGDGLYSSMRIGRDVFTSRGEAEAAARAMAERKLKSLEKQRVKLEKLAREPKWEKR